MTAGDGIVQVGTQAIAEITGYSISHTSDTVENTVIGDASRTYVPTLKGFSATIDAMFDPLYATSHQDDFAVGSTITFTIYPDGLTGTRSYGGSGIVTDSSFSAAVGEMITVNFSLQGTGDFSDVAV